MYNISLINMPFASLNSPSLALTQLKSVLDSMYSNRFQLRYSILIKILGATRESNSINL